MAETTKKMNININALFAAAQLALAEALDRELYLPVKEELKHHYHSLGQKKELFKGHMEKIINDLRENLQLAADITIFSLSSEEGHKLDPPHTVRSVKIAVTGFKKVPYKYVSVRPCKDGNTKTYLGILLGECSLGGQGWYNKDKQEIFISDRLNPMIFVPDLMTVVLGAESWWGPIDKPEDIQQITDTDIDNVWYIKALKEIAQKENNEKDIPET